MSNYSNNNIRQLTEDLRQFSEDLGLNLSPPEYWRIGGDILEKWPNYSRNTHELFLKNGKISARLIDYFPEDLSDFEEDYTEDDEDSEEDDLEEKQHNLDKISNEIRDIDRDKNRYGYNEKSLEERYKDLERENILLKEKQRLEKVIEEDLKQKNLTGVQRYNRKYYLRCKYGLIKRN